MNAAILEALVALARVDQARRQVDQRHGGLPARLARVEEAGSRLKAELARTEQALAEARKQRRGREQETEVLDKRINEDVTRLNSIRNNIEYQALLKQIAEAKNRKTVLENEALELMEREDELGRRLGADGGRMAADLAALAGERAVLEEEGRRLEADLRAKDGERARLLAELAGDLRGRYQRLGRAKQGLAVVPVVKGACGGCFSALPPQRVNEARQGARLVLCAACSGILVWDAVSGSQ
jgi:predicted  nucleic acid-binding Zn-ribbon protein